MQTSNLQVGFKKHTGCVNTIYAVQQLVQYYNIYLFAYLFVHCVSKKRQ